ANKKHLANTYYMLHKGWPDFSKPARSLSDIAARTPEVAAPNLTVAELEVFSIRVNRRGNWTILRLQTDGGVSGLGEASQSDFQDAETLLYLKQFSQLLRGR